MEIVIENQTELPPTIPSTVNNNYGGLPVTSGHPYYYSTLPARRSQHKLKQSADFDMSSVRRVDKSGLLEMPEPERCRSRHLTGAESHTGTLPRRIDRLGLLEAVPEVPDQPQSQQSPEITSNMIERHLTGAENDHRDQNRITPSPRPPRSPIDKNSQIDKSLVSTPPVSSPYSHRQLSPKPSDSIFHDSSANSDNDKPNCGQFTNLSTKFLPIDAQRNRQSYVDLTGATYTKSNSPLIIGRANTTIEVSHDDDDIKQTPDCLSRLSPRLRGDRQSPMTVSSVPDVIEAHGSKKCGGDGGKDIKPEGERAEAEGCEHTAIESLEEARVSFKASNKILHNDNIQTLRVIILSEQL